MKSERTQEIIIRVKGLITELNNKQIDREELIQLLIVSLFSMKHIFLLGEPGVSKTGILEIFSSVIGDGADFSICIKHDTKYEEIFGDRYRDDDGRLTYDTRNSLVEASFAVIDETWKGDSKIMNSLLSAMSNYRTIDIVGKGKVKIPLLMVGGASNELPIDKEVRPLRDRFQFSYKVQKISNEESWLKFISRDYDRNPILNTKFLIEEIKYINDLSTKVKIPADIYNTIYKIRQEVVLHKIGVSERKFDGAVDIFLVTALLNERDEVNHSDLFLMMHMMWEEEKDISKIKKIIFETIFGTTDSVIQYINSIESNIKILNSLITGILNDFLKFRKTFAHTEMHSFDLKKQNVIQIINDYTSLAEEIKSIKNHYHYSLDIENKIINNFFVSEFKSPVYQSVDIEIVYALEEKVLFKKEELSLWVNNYSELYTYNNMVNNV